MILAESNVFKGLSKEFVVEIHDKCEKELIDSVEGDIRPYFYKIEQETFDCARKTPYNLDVRQRSTCINIQREIISSSFAVTGGQTNEECRDVYKSQLIRCDLIKDCCPQFENCQTQTKSLHNYDNALGSISKRVGECISSIEGKPILSDAQISDPLDDFVEDDSFIEEEVTPTTTSAPQSGDLIPTIAPADKVFNDLVHLLFPGFTTIAPLTAPSATTIAVVTTTKPKSTTKKASTKNKFFNNGRKAITRTPPLDNSPASEAIGGLFCDRFLECESVVREQYKICDERYMPASKLYNITDYRLRTLFLSNSRVSDSSVKHRCLDSVDSDSQRQLVMLRSLVDEENAKCIRTNTSVNDLSVTVVKECRQVRLLELFADLFITHPTSSDRSQDNGEKCYNRVRQIGEQCSRLRLCCPQSVQCELDNRSKEAAKFAEIVEQLRDEQSLCEKRRMRILNGVV